MWKAAVLSLQFREQESIIWAQEQSEKLFVVKPPLRVCGVQDIQSPEKDDLINYARQHAGSQSRRPQWNFGPGRFYTSVRDTIHWEGFMIPTAVFDDLLSTIRVAVRTRPRDLS